MRLPDLGRILKRPSIERPREEFELPAPPEERPTRLPDSGSPPPPALSLKEELEDEAGRLQELYELLVETAEPLDVPVPETERALYGETLRTEDYLRSLRDRSPKARGLRRLFEQGALDGCGVGASWPVLLAPRVLTFQDGLLQTLSVLNGTLLTQTYQYEAAARDARIAEKLARGETLTPEDHEVLPGWGREASRSLLELGAEQLRHSRRYRGKVAQALGTYGEELGQDVLIALFTPATRAALTQLRPALKGILELLRMLRHTLCLAMTLRMLEFRQVREALEKLLEGMLVEMFLQQLAALVDRARLGLLTPLLQRLSGSARGEESELLKLIGNRTARALVETIYGAVFGINGYYTEVLSDILRDSRKRTLLALEEVQALGERNTIGRWIQHLDEAILLCNTLLAQVGSLDHAVDLIANFTHRQLHPHPSRAHRRVREEAEYRESLQGGWEFRSGKHPLA